MSIQVSVCALSKVCTISHCLPIYSIRSNICFIFCLILWLYRFLGLLSVIWFSYSILLLNLGLHVIWIYSMLGFEILLQTSFKFSFSQYKLSMVFAVTTTNQAVSALEMLRENRNKYDLVISDVNMPDMDGFKLLELVGLEMDLPVISKQMLFL